jgi:hypothetical protein
LEVFDDYDLGSYGMIASDNTLNGYSCAGSPVFNFASSSLVLLPSHSYHWLFKSDTGNPSTAAAVQFYGTNVNTAGGLFNNTPLVNAKFILTGDTGVLFSN